MIIYELESQNEIAHNEQGLALLGDLKIARPEPLADALLMYKLR